MRPLAPLTLDTLPAQSKGPGGSMEDAHVRKAQVAGEAEPETTASTQPTAGHGTGAAQADTQTAHLFLEQRLRIKVGKELRRNVETNVERQPSAANASRVCRALASLRRVRLRKVGLRRRAVLPTRTWQIDATSRTPAC